MLKESASQTAGPYVHIGLMPNFAGLPNVFPADLGQDMRIAEPAGEPIEIVLRVLDGTAAPLTDAVVELWQADADGRYAVPGAFLGFGRQATDAETGECRFRTIKPGRVPFGDGRAMAPHVALFVVARGINLGLHTRLYFADEAPANAEDPVLAMVDAARRPTLLAQREGGVYRHDIHLQGEHETVFFDV
ncbi:MAG: protocatechuate 3,4-dioxygenase subunit alpha [Mesorhizobium sp.]